jgi:phage-related holin
MVFDWLAFLTGYWETVQVPLAVLLLLTILDFIFGVLVAWRKGEFEWAKIGDVSLGNVLKVLSYAALALVVQLGVLGSGIVTDLQIDQLSAQGLAIFVGLGILGSFIGHIAYLVPGWDNGTKRFGIKAT